MKTINISKNEGSLERKTILRIGEALYQMEDVCAVEIRVDFKDGSKVVFEKDEEEDTINEHMKKRMK